jgi:hypothetical protein
MNRSSWINVEAAFEFLLEELEAELAHIERVGTRGLTAHEHDRARAFSELAIAATGFRREVRALRCKWQKKADWIGEVERKYGIDADWRSQDRLNRVVRTPLADYVDPILGAIHAVGGVAQTADLARAIPRLMQDVLRPADEEALDSAAGVPRWRNALAWARRDMVDDGWLAPGVPPNVWQATEAGLWRHECSVLEAGVSDEETVGRTLAPSSKGGGP